ncbi:hypothetical protein AMJ39_02085 [candidate division TA06 bacterium DG_24]|uniref:Sialidase domain-containing protein n=2 Tax=Bacteria division TA06 TaxID=1156500 RepID=A0A0S8JRR3_UNCT6|nr:MAG: hypothetical protein AMJ39_02085 [candidate division TA06 bacterium DG_24]KPL11532.1 MAG: hypothetical protein AMJ71_00590 [candidate division TA06 bacterium SM1_40]
MLWVQCGMIGWLLFATGSAVDITPAYDLATGTVRLEMAEGSREADCVGARTTIEGDPAGFDPILAIDELSWWVFSPDVRVNDIPAGTHLWPELAIGPEGWLNVVWMDDRTGQHHIYFSQSTDGGLTWSASELVDDRTTGTYSRFPSVAVDADGNVYAAWEDDRLGVWDVYSSRRILQGDEWVWTPDVKVNTAGSSTSPSDYMRASIAANGQERVYVSWTDWREGVYHQVYFARSTDGGATWSENVRVSDETGNNPVAGESCLWASPDDLDDLYCTWNDWREPGPSRFPEVYFARSTDAGDSWTPNVRVNDISAYYQQVASRVIGVDETGRILIAWYNDDFAGPTEVRVSASTDGGLSFGPSSQANDAEQGVGTYPSLFYSRDGVACASWMDYRNGDWDIYLSSSTDGGLSWTVPDSRVDDDTTGSAAYNPIVALISPDAPHVVWQDYRRWGGYDIYASRGERRIGVCVELVPTGPTLLPPGDTIRCTITVANFHASPVTGDFWLMVRPSGGPERLIPAGLINVPNNPIHGGLESGEIIAYDCEINIPLATQEGTYAIIGRVGIYPGVIADESSFEIHVI